MIESLPLWALAPGFAEQARLAPKPRSANTSTVRDGLAVVRLMGTLDKPALVDFRREVYKLADDDTVREILLHVDSPGGTVAGTADAAQAVARAAAKKPVTAYLEDLAASAAYWVASQATRIVANRTAVVGSIGVFIVVGDASRLWEKLGVDWFVVRSGRFKGGTVEGAKISAETLEHLQERVDTIARIFITDVARGRRMTVDRVAELADGRTFTGMAARAAGLVDEIASLEAVQGEVTNRVAVEAARTDTETVPGYRSRFPESWRAGSFFTNPI